METFAPFSSLLWLMTSPLSDQWEARGREEKQRLRTLWWHRKVRRCFCQTIASAPIALNSALEGLVWTRVEKIKCLHCQTHRFEGKSNGTEIIWDQINMNGREWYMHFIWNGRRKLNGENVNFKPVRMKIFVATKIKKIWTPYFLLLMNPLEETLRQHDTNLKQVFL